MLLTTEAGVVEIKKDEPSGGMPGGMGGGMGMM
jgi:hypothetical protein